MKRFKRGTLNRELLDAFGILAEQDIEYQPVEKSNELRYTLGPMYIPDTLDAQNEFADSEELRKAIWAVNEKGDKRVRKQHGNKIIGVQRELFQLPWEQKLDLKLPDGTVTKSVTLPAGTVYTGVQWTPEGWSDVKKGLIRGLSMGGRAVRVRNVEADIRKLA